MANTLGFDGFITTSARDGIRIDDLARAIRSAIDWEQLPAVSSIALFEAIMEFLVDEKKAGRVLTSTDDLYRAFTRSSLAPKDIRNVRTEFDACVGRVEARGLIRRLSFGDLILLQPELLDAYASALVVAAKEEPDGLGSIREEDAREGRFPVPKDERTKREADARRYARTFCATSLPCASRPTRVLTLFSLRSYRGIGKMPRTQPAKRSSSASRAPSTTCTQRSSYDLPTASCSSDARCGATP